MPDQLSDAAQRGTLLHEHDAAGTEAEDVGDQEILEINQALRQEFLLATLLRLGIPDNAKRLEVVEQRFTLKDQNGDDLIGIDGLPFGGQPDRITYFPEYRTLFVFDNKFGRLNVPPAEINEQLKVYAVMLADPVFGDFNSDRVFVVITQPLAKPQLTAAEYDQETIAAAKEQILSVWRRIKAPDQPRNPSWEACHYCRASATCPATLAAAKQASELKISELPVDELERMAPQMKLAGEIVEKFWARLRYIAATKPHLLTRYEIKENSPIRFVEPQDTVEAFTKLRGLLAPEEFCRCCKFSPAKADGVVAKKFNIKVQDAKQQIAQSLGDTLKSKPKGSSLVERVALQLT